jgi:hypothetical protein
MALFDLIQAIVTAVAAEVDGVSTLPAGTDANVTVSVSGGTLRSDSASCSAMARCRRSAR